ncbi:MAG: hypothetical protein WKF43_10245 [Acidimicrobiales bacterium]
MSPMLAIEFSRGIEDAWADVATFVPKFLAFLVILIIGYLIAKAIAKVAAKALERVGFDNAVERGGVKRALEQSKYDASDIVGKIIFYALFLIVLQMAFGVFGTNPVSDLIEGVIAYLPKVLAALLIVVVGAALAAAAKELIEASLGNLDYATTIAFVASTAILVTAIFAALSQLQIAPDIINGLFYAVLAVVAGSLIIAIGGGGIRPMQQRWENVLAKYDEEKPRIDQERQGSKERIEARARERQAQLRQAAGDDSRSGGSTRR